MAKKKKVEEKISASTIAVALGKVRESMADLKKEDTRLTSMLKDALHAENKKEAGNYKISEKITLKVIEPEVALQWAAQTNCLKIDTSKAKEILRHTFEEPEKFGFERVMSESIIPIKGGRASEEE